MQTCQQVDGDFLSKIYWVRGDGSSSYLSNGKLSRTNGSELLQENMTLGCASLDGYNTKQHHLNKLQKTLSE